MAQLYDEITGSHKAFIEAQKVFFVSTAAVDGRINISPKGLDSLRVLGERRVVWLNMTGSGNETAAHVQEDPRMTIMFTAFEGSPLVLRLYGNAKVVHMNDPEWAELYQLFEPVPGARQIFDLAVDLVKTSCGMSVPRYEYVGERTELTDWCVRLGDEGVREYWKKKNQFSLDGKPTNILTKNT